MTTTADKPVPAPDQSRGDQAGDPMQEAMDALHHEQAGMTEAEPIQLPLAGLRVIELGHFIAAPFCARLLGDLGADIIKIEPPTGDPARQWGERINGHSLFWSMHARNKRSVVADLKTEQGRELVLDLVEHCDALVENLRPGHLAKLGLSVASLRRRNPRLVIAHISGYGQDGPSRDRAAFGLIGEAVGGLRHLTNHAPGTTDLPPVRVGVSLGDSLAGLYAALGMVAALWQRDRTGGDGHARTLDVALSESVLSITEGMLPEFGALGKIKQPSGGSLTTAAPTNAYPTRDSKWILIGANSDPLFGKLCDTMGQPDLSSHADYRDNAGRLANSASLDRLIGAWTSLHSVSELERVLTQADIPNSTIYDASDCANDPQFLARHMIEEVDDPLFSKPVLQVGVVPKVMESPGGVRWAGAALGQHSDEVIAELLGTK